MSETWDVIVVGSGNAGFCAAHAARQEGARVLVLEKAPRAWAGGNSYFTAGAFRTSHDGLADLKQILETPLDDRFEQTSLAPYSDAEFLDDLRRVTRDRTDEHLATCLVSESRATMTWLHEIGLRFELMFHRQAYEVDGRYRFWGGLALGVVGGGKGLIRQHLAAATASGSEVRFESPVIGLRTGAGGAVCGVQVSTPVGVQEISARSVILTCGGFEANAQMRAAYLGAGWDLALVRGTPYNTGEGMIAAIALGAQPYGHWSGCHSVAWDAKAPPTGDLELTNQFTRGGYPFGIVVNVEGNRFLDEGDDFRNFTYAKYGAEVLRQPGGTAVQIFDAKATHLLRPEDYQSPGVTRIESDSLEELAKLAGIEENQFLRTIEEFNSSIVGSSSFDPTIKDGSSTAGVTPPKSNWAQPVDTPPYLAFPVTCGITFTFGGLRTDTEGRVQDTAGRRIPGLYAAGETMGGIFYFNYPGGAGLTSGAVYGRRAGSASALDGV
jgi:tricarballylate dehydrogenase